VVHGRLHAIVQSISAPIRETIYVARSHIWGDLQDQEQITLAHIYRLPIEGEAGVCFYHSYNITTRLAAALRGIRGFTLKGAPRGFWCDSISINQGYHKERSDQVAMMAEVYSSASMVLIWMDAVKSWQTLERVNFELLRRFAMDPKRNFDHIHEFIVSVDCSSLSGVDDYQYDGVCYQRLRKPFQAFYSNAWFRRVSVIQEVLRGHGNAVVMTKSSKELLPFVTVALGLYYALTEFSGLMGDNAHLLLWARLFLPLVAQGISLQPGTINPNPPPWFRSRMDLLDWFSSAMHMDTTDPRDKLFALVGLADETAMLKAQELPAYIKPDYTKSVV
jgi:hypothetical protein